MISLPSFLESRIKRLLIEFVAIKKISERSFPDKINHLVLESSIVGKAARLVVENISLYNRLNLQVFCTGSVCNVSGHKRQVRPHRRSYIMPVMLRAIIDTDRCV
jgi:hypothetical protein